MEGLMKLLNTRGVGEQITDQVMKLKYLKSQNDKNKKMLYSQLDYLFVDWSSRDFSVLQQYEDPQECELCEGVYPSVDWGTERGFCVCLKCAMECENEEYENYKNGYGIKYFDREE